uniref:Uncharacterized protein n=1 Tax=Ascaris lumbricoides TaxID=6252 RepID=A0A0M3I336_ASCLU
MFYFLRTNCEATSLGEARRVADRGSCSGKLFCLFISSFC